MTDQDPNELIARKLGWHKRDFDDWEKSGDPARYYKCPDFCHSIEAAWEVVEHFGKEWNVNLYISRGGKSAPFVKCSIFHHEVTVNASDPRFAEGEGFTAPRAICEAFLKLP